MSSTNSTVFTGARHRSPPLGILAVVFTALFCAGLYPVTYFGGRPSFPVPWAPAHAVLAFFQQRAGAAVLCAFLHFGSAIPLGIFTAAIVSRLRFLGVRAAGVEIALFGGFATAALLMASSTVLWAIASAGAAQDPSLTMALHFLNFALGGLAIRFRSGCSWRASLFPYCFAVWRRAGSRSWGWCWRLAAS